ncbi:MAG: hypothetical protein P8X86_21280 [Desulfofustis sp.]
MLHGSAQGRETKAGRDDEDPLSGRPLSLLGGALFHVPMFVPTIGPVAKLLGIAAGSSLMVRLNMTLILQIALLFGYDIDSRERLKELIAIIGATGLASASSQFPQLAGYPLHYRGLIGGAAVMTTSQLIGEAAIRYYGRASTIEIDVPEGSPVTT